VKIEYRYSAQSGNDELSARRRTVPIYYYYAGERVGPGHYECTFCGETTTVTSTRTLPPCHACDSAEFALAEAA